MGKVFACFSIALHNFKKWAVNPRLYILLLIEVLYLHSRLSPVGELCVRTGYKVTPYLLPFLLDEGSAVMMLFLGVVLLFCDAPFIEDEQPYIMLRSGRRIWFIGQMLYIVMASVLYFIVLYFISVLGAAAAYRMERSVGQAAFYVFADIGRGAERHQHSVCTRHHGAV